MAVSRIEEVIESTSFPIGLMEDAQVRAAMEQTRHKLPSTDWLIYNALNYVINHEAETLQGRKAERIDREVLDYLYNY